MVTGRDERDDAEEEGVQRAVEAGVAVLDAGGGGDGDGDGGGRREDG